MELDYDKLLCLTAEIGYQLMESGAEIYRVEESIQRLLTAYGVPHPDPFVIPNCIIVSFRTPEGKSLTQVRRQPGLLLLSGHRGQGGQRPGRILV